MDTVIFGPDLAEYQARAEGGAEGAWAPAPLSRDAQSAPLSRQLFFFLNNLLWRPAQCNY